MKMSTMSLYHVKFSSWSPHIFCSLEGDKVLEFNQFHLTKCANAEKLGRKVDFNMVMLNGPRKTRGKK